MISLQSLDIVIGMVIVFLTVSMVCSSVNELIASALGLRAATLRGALDSLLGSSLAQTVIDHPAIPAAKNNGAKTPAYIEPTLFASALLDYLVPGPVVPQAAAGPQIAAAQAALAAPANPAATAKVAAAFAASPSREALSAFVQTANGDYARLQQQVSGWFDAYMDRVSGQYKRNSQIYIAVIAIFVVGILNVDSLKAFNKLNTQPAFTQGLVAQTQTLLKSHNDSATTTANIGAEVDTLNTRITTIPVPIGWHVGPNQEDRLIPWWRHLIGLLITMVAASLGAPFWFDALSKLANLRSVGTKPDSPAAPAAPASS